MELQTSPDQKFTPEEVRFLVSVTNVPDFAAAVADPCLGRYFYWYIRHLEARFTENKPHDALRPYLTNTTQVDLGLMHTLALISESLRKGKTQSMQSIRQVLLGITLEEAQDPAPYDTDSDSDASPIKPLNRSNTTEFPDLARCSRIIFHAIGQLTMLYTTPPLDIATGPYSPDLPLQLDLVDPSNPAKTLRSKAIVTTLCPLTQAVTELRLKTLLNRFGQFIPPSLKDMNAQSLSFSDTIFSANLSCQAMVRTAGLKIVWVDAFPLHLEFDARTTTLKLFRFPSFCAMLAHPQCSQSLLFHRLFSDEIADDEEPYFGVDATKSPITQDFFVELLCTYRLIFGQHGRSAHRLYQKLKPSAVDTDPLLDELCGTSSKRNQLLELIDAFPQKLLHSAESDFPAFGNRLLVLQHYIIAQSPNSIKALWYDRRDVHRFWTFWAVIIFGGLSLILSVMQTVLSGVQVSLARQPGC